jgi:hypothetical protein
VSLLASNQTAVLTADGFRVHPLEPLSVAEIETTSKALTAGAALGPSGRLGR